MTTFEQVRPIADAVLYEGYVLYPYRADDAKNRVRWQFGVLAPPAFTTADASERASLESEVLLDGPLGSLQARVRFLQVQRRTVEQRVGGRMVTVSRLDAGDTAYLPFDEALPREVDVHADLAGLCAASVTREFTVVGGTEVEDVAGGRLVRERLPLSGRVVMGAEVLPGPYGTLRLHVEVHNTTVLGGQQVPSRQEALRSSLVAAHLMLRVDRGRFLSLTDPPEWASGYAAQCHNAGVWPVLAGPPGAHDLVLCSPIILPDHPQVAPESTTEFFDGTEMDEMLSLRALTLTEEEKRAVRGTDPRAAELLAQVEDLPPELLVRLHGAVRSLSQGGRRVQPPPQPDPEVLEVEGVVIREGSRVLLRPGVRRADAQDLFLAGRTATVTRVLHDLDGNDHVAVLLDDDPGQDVALVHGRFLYFAPDEVEPLGVSP
ncbi:MAG TPA: hypothetical protein VGN19_11915 [Pedococcus sp.]|nr:hypothetical protein [Pedococcus sp.]